MSVVFSGTWSGRFVSTGLNTFIPLPAGVDFMWVKNETVSYAAGAGTGAEFYWASGDAIGQGTIYVKTAATNALQVGQIAANSGFYLQNTSVNNPGAPLADTGITGATPPLVTTANTAGLVAGSSVVRIYNTPGAQQLGGIDFTVGAIVPGVSFALQNGPVIVATGAVVGSFAIIPFNPYFYPYRRTIAAITQATQAIVTLTVTHYYTVGQNVRFVIPTVDATHFGMTPLNGVEATIVAVGQADANGFTNTITVNWDTTGYPAFAWPLTASGPFTPAQVVPVGENTAQALASNVNILGDSTTNTAQIGMLLVAGTGSPAGVNADVITWVAGKSFNQ